MGKMAGKARSGMSPAQAKAATSLARGGSVGPNRIGERERRGEVVPGTGEPPANPVLLIREVAPRTNADAMGVDTFHASPVANPAQSRHVGRTAEMATDGYGPDAAGKPTGNATIGPVAAEPAGRFIDGSPTPVNASEGFANDPSPSGGAAAPSTPADEAAGRFVNGGSAPVSFGPAGTFK